MTTQGKLRVAVIGGGVLGVSTARALARHGADVTLLTEGRFASGASGRSLAWLNSFGPRSAAYHQLRMLGLERYRTFSSEVDASSYLKFDGGLTWAAAGDTGHRQAFEHMRKNGYAAEWLTPDEVAKRTPGVDASAIPAEGAIFNPGEGWVELPRLIDQLARDLSSLGGRVVTESGPCRVVTDGGRVTAVAKADGDLIDVDAAVLATGASVPKTLAELGITIPDATPTALLVRTEAIQTSLRAVLNTPRVAVRPTPEGALVLDSAWSEEEVVTHPDGSYEVHDDTVQGLLKEASLVLEGNPNLVAESCGVGPKPIPGDGEPVLGQLEDLPGYHVAFTHSGATLGLIAGELLADEIVRGEPHPMLEAFRPSRFTSTSTNSR